MAFIGATQPLCHCCGKLIPKRTESHLVRDPRGGNTPDAIIGPLHSKEECQRKVNTAVVSVRYHEDYSSVYGSGGRKPDQPRQVSHFTTWDGESYEDEFFCSGPCVRRFAYIMARAGRCTNLYNEAVAERAA